MIQAPGATHAGAGTQGGGLIVLRCVVVLQQLAVHIVRGLIIEGHRLGISSQVLSILLISLGILCLPVIKNPLNKIFPAIEHGLTWS